MNSFINNSAHHSGGAIYILGNNIGFIGTNNHINNSAHWKGGVNLGLTFNVTNNFISNSVGQSGGAIFVEHTALTFTDSETSSFVVARTLRRAMKQSIIDLQLHNQTHIVFTAISMQVQTL